VFHSNMDGSVVRNADSGSLVPDNKAVQKTKVECECVSFADIWTAGRPSSSMG